MYIDCFRSGTCIIFYCVCADYVLIDTNQKKYGFLIDIVNIYCSCIGHAYQAFVNQTYQHNGDDD